jgi:hypothetical protein
MHFESWAVQENSLELKITWKGLVYPSLTTLQVSCKIRKIKAKVGLLNKLERSEVLPNRDKNLFQKGISTFVKLLH